MHGSGWFFPDGRFLRHPDQPDGEKPFPETIVEACQRGDQGQPVEKGKVTAENKDDLKKDNKNTCDMTGETWPENKPGSDQFGQIVKPDSDFQDQLWQKMEPPAERSGDRLGFEMVVQCCPVTPHLIPSHLDHACTQHDAENQPAKKYNDLK